MNQLSLGALLVHKHWQQQRIPFMQQTFILPHSNFTPNHPPCSWDEERTNGRRAQEFKSLGREQKELAAFRVKSCLHPLCCKIRFLCFLKANALETSLPSQEPRAASSSPAAQGSTSEPPRSWMERGDQCLQTQSCQELSPSHPLLWEPGEAGRISLHLLRNLTLQTLQAPGYPLHELLPTITSREVRWERLLWEERKVGKHNSNPALAGEFFQEPSQAGLTLREVCAWFWSLVLNLSYCTASTTNQLHDDFCSSKPSWIASISLKLWCSSNFPHVFAFPGFYSPSVLTDPH